MCFSGILIPEEWRKTTVMHAAHYYTTISIPIEISIKSRHSICIPLQCTHTSKYVYKYVQMSIHTHTHTRTHTHRLQCGWKDSYRASYIFPCRIFFLLFFFPRELLSGKVEVFCKTCLFYIAPHLAMSSAMQYCCYIILYYNSSPALQQQVNKQSCRRMRRVKVQ